MDRNKIIESLENTNAKLRDLCIDIENENGEGKQFDFVSHPSLSDVLDRLRTTINQIDCIVYQD